MSREQWEKTHALCSCSSERRIRYLMFYQRNLGWEWGGYLKDSALCSPDILPLSGTQLACPYLRSLAFPLDYSSGRYESLLPRSALCPNRFLWLPYYICTLSSASMSLLWFFFSGILFLLIYYIFYFLIFTFVSLCPECKHCDDSGFCLFTIFECLLHASITLHVIFPAYMECVLTLSLHVQCCITFNL